MSAPVASSSSSLSTANPTVGTGSSQLVTEIPSSLKQLARLVVRGFYLIEEALIVDMLVRYPCMREEDLAELLKFDRKFLRSKVAGLKNDKIIQVKQRIETDPEGKVARMNCYYINFKIFVNIVKYKLDHMRKKMETSERDATTRSSFKCMGCAKTFTDLEAGELFDHQTMEFKCTFCSSVVEEDESAGPQKDSRHTLAKFNEQTEKLYELLRAVENIQLAPSLLEPDPEEIDIKGKGGKNVGAGQRANVPAEGGKWSGDATRMSGLRAEDQQVNITFGEKEKENKSAREMPIWMQQSTVTKIDDTSMSSFPSIMDEDSMAGDDSNLNLAEGAGGSGDGVSLNQPDNDEITSLLLRHENRNAGSSQAHIPKDSDSDKSDDSDEDDKKDPLLRGLGVNLTEDSNLDATDQVMSEDEEDGDIPTVRVGDEEITVTDVNEDIIARMTIEEKERYTQIFQDFYSHMYD